MHVITVSTAYTLNQRKNKHKTGIIYEGLRKRNKNCFLLIMFPKLTPQKINLHKNSTHIIITLKTIISYTIINHQNLHFNSDIPYHLKKHKNTTI